MNSENVEDLSIRGFEEEKLNIVLEQIEKAITTISNVISLETTNNLVIKKTLNQIVPTLGELKCCVASLNVNVNEKEDNISDMSSFAFTQAAANPLCELNLSISVLTQIICEKASDDCEHSLLKAELATPLVELRNALEILQHDVISQNEENVNDPKISSSVANAVQSIQSCIVVIQEQNLLENADEVSTLDDISAIKTTADMLFTDYLISPEIHEITAEINAENTLYASTECLKVLNDHIIMLQNDESMAVLHALSKREESACIKTIVARLETLHCAIEGILHPITYEESQKRSSIPNATQLLTIIQPIRELLQSLSVIDISNMSSESTSSIDQIKLLTQNVSKLEIYLRDSLDFINVSVETSDGILEISTKINTLKKLCEELKNNLDAAEKYGFVKCPELLLLDDSVNTILNTTSFPQEINITQVKLSLEGLQLSIAMAQDEIIGFSVDNPIKLHHETKILKSIDDIEKTIASLVQLRFIDIGEVSNP
ncbi:jg23709, partial [Pararge aegeria aegeria]